MDRASRAARRRTVVREPAYQIAYLPVALRALLLTDPAGRHDLTGIAKTTGL